MQDFATRAGTILGGTASGMIPMAIFTPVYAIWPIFAWPIAGTIFFVLAVAFSTYLFVTGIRTLRRSRQLPNERNAADDRIAKVMPIISNIMGFGILIAIIMLTVFDLTVLILPTVAVLVALHFFPMAQLFGRTIDYYLGSLMLIAAIFGFIVATQGNDWEVVWATTGILGALVTSAYGLNALLSARRVLTLFATSD